ncbi:MAG: transposase [Rhodobacter sp.]|nr:transposase [Rhodobacter sp.]
MSTERMVAELPKARDVGAKRNAKGYRESWRGYKMHIDAADGDVPVSCILTSASPHDSQAAIPLARMTAERVDHRYGLMDAVCDSREIGAHARMAGRVAVIDANPRRDAAMGVSVATEARAQRNAGHVRHDRVRYGQRSSVERVNSALKDSYGGRHVRVRGNLKVACHLMFGVLALTVHRLMRLTI